MHAESTSFLKTSDPQIFEMIEKETERQEYGLEMIASENYASRAVMEAQGSTLTNKYAEGYPGKRYYGGCEIVDQSENLAIERAKKLFNCEHANVQPHSGSQANMAVYLAALEPGEKVLGMDLSNGGHLTHGSPVNFSGILFDVASYGLDPKTGRLNYDHIHDIAKKEKPKMIIAGYSAYPRLLDFKAFREIADGVGAKLLVDMAHFSGLVAGEAHPSPVPYADYVTSTTHKTLRGPRGGIILCKEEYAKKVNSRIFPGIQGGPLEHIIAAKAVSFGECLRPEFKTYSAQVIKNCQALAKVLMDKGIKLVTDGTDNHLVLLDLSDRDITGKEGEDLLGHAAITVNKNTVPNEKRSPFVTSGLRLGTPALTTRGFKETEMELVGQWIAKLIDNPKDQALVEKTKADVRSLCEKFPIYQ